MIDPGKIENLFAWMLDGARPSGDARQIVAGICGGLVEAGVPVERFALFIYTLHPNLLGRRFRWLKGEGVDISNANLNAFVGPEYHDNPLPGVRASGQALRRRLCDPDCPDDYLILKQFREEGVTDYLVQPLVFTNGETHLVTWTTKARDGFDRASITALEKIRLPLARLTETYMLRLNAISLLSAYVGRESGARILSGQVHRGQIEEISACVVFADLVGFTSYSNFAPAEDVLALLNRFHDRVVPPIAARGGEVLKFMGDGLLAIFPVTDKRGAKQACQAALNALEEASGGEKKSSFSAENPPFRAAVHLGSLQYGNIGTAERLDFTAIGPTVNLAARLLQSASELNAQTVLSEVVAKLLSVSTDHLAAVKLKGFAERQRVVPIRWME